MGVEISPPQDTTPPLGHAPPPLRLAPKNWTNPKKVAHKLYIIINIIFCDILHV